MEGADQTDLTAEIFSLIWSYFTLKYFYMKYLPP